MAPLTHRQVSRLMDASPIAGAGRPHSGAGSSRLTSAARSAESACYASADGEEQLGNDAACHGGSSRTRQQCSGAVGKGKERDPRGLRLDDAVVSRIRSSPHPRTYLPAGVPPSFAHRPPSPSHYTYVWMGPEGNGWMGPSGRGPDARRRPARLPPCGYAAAYPAAARGGSLRSRVAGGIHDRSSSKADTGGSGDSQPWDTDHDFIAAMVLLLFAMAAVVIGLAGTVAPVEGAAAARATATPCSAGTDGRVQLPADADQHAPEQGWGWRYVAWEARWIGGRRRPGPRHRAPRMRDAARSRNLLVRVGHGRGRTRCGCGGVDEDCRSGTERCASLGGGRSSRRLGAHGPLCGHGGDGPGRHPDQRAIGGRRTVRARGKA